MALPSRYLLAAAIFSAILFPAGQFTGALTLTSVTRQPAPLAQPDRLPVPGGRAVHREIEDDLGAIENALAAHGNRQNIVPTFFTDLIRTMERAGLQRPLVREVAISLARNPKLDELAAMTIAGCLPGYLAASGDDPDTALADLISYVQDPAQYANRVDADLPILAPETAARINEKLRGGKPAAAEMIMEHALLARFNPGLAAKLLVPQ